MYNYNRDVYQAEHERFERMLTARQRQVPYEMRRDAFKQATGWLSAHVGGPIEARWSGFYEVVSPKVAVLYRRASTRLAGLILNALESLLEMAPGRT